MKHLSFLTALVRFETDLWNAVDARLHSEEQLTLASVHTMLVVQSRAGSCRVQDIADEIGITVGASSKLVDRLEASGMLVRAANPDDRRSSVITLTPKGSEAHRRGSDFVDRYVHTLLGDVPELESLTTRLVELRAAVAAR